MFWSVYQSFFLLQLNFFCFGLCFLLLFFFFCFTFLQHQEKLLLKIEIVFSSDLNLSRNKRAFQSSTSAALNIPNYGCDDIVSHDCVDINFNKI